MDWPRVKTLLIVLLLTANLILGGLYALRQWEEAKEQAVAWEAWQRAFEAMDVTLDDTLRSVVGVQLCALYLPRPEEEERALARYFLGDVSFQDLGGHVSQYESQAGTGRFRTGGSFDIRFNTAMPKQKKTPLEQAKADAAAAKLDAYPLTVCRETAQGGQSEISCKQIVQGYPVYNSSLSFFYGADGLQSVSGLFLLAPVSMQEPEPGLTAGSLLMQFAQSWDGPLHVTDMEPGYVLTDDGPNLWKLQPVCRIVAEGRAILLNADTGAVMVENLETMTFS